MEVLRIGSILHVLCIIWHVALIGTLVVHEIHTRSDVKDFSIKCKNSFLPENKIMVLNWFLYHFADSPCPAKLLFHPVAAPHGQFHCYPYVFECHVFAMAARQRREGHSRP